MTDKNKRDRMVVMLKLFRYLKPYWWQIIILLCAVAGQVWSALQLPALMASIVNDGIVAGDVDFIWGAGIKMVLYALVAAMGASLANFLSARIGTAFSRDLRRDIFAKVLSFSVADMNKFSTASLITRTTNDVSQVQQAAVMCMSMLFGADDGGACGCAGDSDGAGHDVDYCAGGRGDCVAGRGDFGDRDAEV